MFYKNKNDWFCDWNSECFFSGVSNQLCHRAHTLICIVLRRCDFCILFLAKLGLIHLKSCTRIAYWPHMLFLSAQTSQHNISVYHSFCRSTFFIQRGFMHCLSCNKFCAPKHKLGPIFFQEKVYWQKITMCLGRLKPVCCGFFPRALPNKSICYCISGFPHPGLDISQIMKVNGSLHYSLHRSW